TGKTMLGRWIASKVNATFINVSASILFSKWIGESEKMVNTLFQVADHYQPTVIFIDEVDSILGARSEGDHESTRRLKNEFLAALDGITSRPESRILFLGATNLPWQIDAAALRRFPKKLYTPLPGIGARKYLITRLLDLHHASILTETPAGLNEEVIHRVSESTEGYSGSDIKQLMCAAAIVPIREALAKIVSSGDEEEYSNVIPRPLGKADLDDALAHSHASDAKLEEYIEWNDKFGSWPTQVVMHDE
ncbi:Meiotic spindle formation protein mei-1, putative, partial [Perkinsus marinus ATCC 50983]